MAQERAESFTLEYKEKFSSSLVKSIAAMANTYGGIVMVGVVDRGDGDRIIGVPEDTITKIVNACFESLEPPWQPELVPVHLPGRDDRVVLVIRVHANEAPRPILLGGAAPIRLHGRNATADRGRLEQLFQETPAGPRSMAPLPAPFLDHAESTSPKALFILRSGLRLPVSDTAAWRALSERGVRDVGDALEDSDLTRGVRAWCAELGLPPLSPPFAAGFNRARRMRLVQITPPGSALQVVAELQLPPAYGTPNSDLLLTLDLVAADALRDAALRGDSSLRSGDVSASWQLGVPRLRALLDALLSTLVSDSLVTALSSLAGVEHIMVPQPASLALRSNIDIQDLLDAQGLTPIPGAGTSRGADVVASPFADLRDSAQRGRQVDDWLEQISLDAGLAGMQRQLDQPPLPPSMR